MPAPIPALFALIDAYALAAARREASVELASWALADAHRAMLAARADVAAALGVPLAALDPLTDDTTTLAEDVLARDAEWLARIDAELAREHRAYCEPCGAWYLPCEPCEHQRAAARTR